MFGRHIFDLFCKERFRSLPKYVQHKLRHLPCFSILYFEVGFGRNFRQCRPNKDDCTHCMEFKLFKLKLVKD